MNKELSLVLLDRIKDLPYIDRSSGLVQVFERIIEGENGVNVKKKIPVTSFATFQECERKQADMIPNSKFKGMIYFEDGGVTSSVHTRNGMQYVSRLRLVCWLNTKAITGASNMLLTAAVVADIMKRLTGNPFNSAPFTRVTVAVIAIPQQDKNIFSKYDYAEADTQYLMAPFEFFAIDLGVTYTVPVGCVPGIISN